METRISAISGRIKRKDRVCLLTQMEESMKERSKLIDRRERARRPFLMDPYTSDNTIMVDVKGKASSASRMVILISDNIRMARRKAMERRFMLMEGDHWACGLRARRTATTLSPGLMADPTQGYSRTTRSTAMARWSGLMAEPMWACGRRASSMARESMLIGLGLVSMESGETEKESDGSAKRSSWNSRVCSLRTRVDQ